MSIINEVISLEQAIQRGEQTWEVLINYFGASDPDVGGQTIHAFPGAGAFGSSNSQRGLRSMFAVAIGPRSQIDRCWVMWDPQVRVASTSDFVRRLSVDSPLTFPQLGNEKNLNVPATNYTNPIVALAFGTCPQVLNVADSFPDDSGFLEVHSFVRKANSFATQFTPIKFGSQRTFNLLHLIFYMTAPPTAIPVKRFPLVVWSDIVLGGSVGTEIYLGSVAVYGRKRIRLSFSASQGDYAIRIGGNRWYTDPMNPPPPAFDFQEKTYATIASITPDSPQLVTLDDPEIDTLHVWATRNATSPSVTAIGSLELKAID